MKKLFLLLAFVSVYACTNEIAETNQLQQRLTELELSIKNAAANSTSERNKYTLADVYTKENPYDSHGLDLYNRVEALYVYLKDTKGNPNSSFDREVTPYINNQVSHLDCNNLELNSDETVLYNSFVSVLNYENTIKIVKEYELFVNQNFKNPAQVKNFLIIISDIKYSSYSTYSKRNFTQWEACLVDCMDDTYGNYNAVQWVLFGVSPGRDVLQNAAICGWDCL